MKGLITKTTGSAYHVLLDDGSTVEAHVKGNFRIRGIRSTNPVAVGDRVELQLPPQGEGRGEAWITEIEDRRNYIIRRSTNLSKETHILAANIDQVALLITLHRPETNRTFVDRFLANAEAYRVPAILIFNKIDLLDEAGLAELQEWRDLYESIGYPTYAISAKNLDKNDPTIQRIFFPLAHSKADGERGQGKEVVTLLSGNSGVGKSTLLNALFGEERTRTAEISDVHHQGMHTTTFSEMYFLPESSPLALSEQSERFGERGRGKGAAIIDTPGIKGFGGIEMDKYEVSHYFREIFRIGRECRFDNCMHTGEPGCAVQEAVVDGRIAVSRFESYISLLGDIRESKYR